MFSKARRVVVLSAVWFHQASLYWREDGRERGGDGRDFTGFCKFPTAYGKPPLSNNAIRCPIVLPTRRRGEPRRGSCHIPCYNGRSSNPPAVGRSILIIGRNISVGNILLDFRWPENCHRSEFYHDPV